MISKELAAALKEKVETPAPQGPRTRDEWGKLKSEIDNLPNNRAASATDEEIQAIFQPLVNYSGLNSSLYTSILVKSLQNSSDSQIEPLIASILQSYDKLKYNLKDALEIILSQSKVPIMEALFSSLSKHYNQTKDELRGVLEHIFIAESIPELDDLIKALAQNHAQIKESVQAALRATFTAQKIPKIEDLMEALASHHEALQGSITQALKGTFTADTIQALPELMVALAKYHAPIKKSIEEALKESWVAENIPQLAPLMTALANQKTQFTQSIQSALQTTLISAPTEKLNRLFSELNKIENASLLPDFQSALENYWDYDSSKITHPDALFQSLLFSIADKNTLSPAIQSALGNTLQTGTDGILSNLFSHCSRSASATASTQFYKLFENALTTALKTAPAEQLTRLFSHCEKNINVQSSLQNVLKAVLESASADQVKLIVAELSRSYPALKETIIMALSDLLLREDETAITTLLAALVEQKENFQAILPNVLTRAFTKTPRPTLTLLLNALSQQMEPLHSALKAALQKTFSRKITDKSNFTQELNHLFTAMGAQTDRPLETVLKLALEKTFNSANALSESQLVLILCELEKTNLFAELPEKILRNFFKRGEVDKVISVYNKLANPLQAAGGPISDLELAEKALIQTINTAPMQKAEALILQCILHARPIKKIRSLLSTLLEQINPERLIILRKILDKNQYLLQSTLNNIFEKETSKAVRLINQLPPAYRNPLKEALVQAIKISAEELSDAGDPVSSGGTLRKFLKQLNDDNKSRELLKEILMDHLKTADVDKLTYFNTLITIMDPEIAVFKETVAETLATTQDENTRAWIINGLSEKPLVLQPAVTDCLTFLKEPAPILRVANALVANQQTTLLENSLKTIFEKIDDEQQLKALVTPILQGKNKESVIKSLGTVLLNSSEKLRLQFIMDSLIRHQTAEACHLIIEVITLKAAEEYSIKPLLLTQWLDLLDKYSHQKIIQEALGKLLIIDRPARLPSIKRIIQELPGYPTLCQRSWLQTLSTANGDAIKRVYSKFIETVHNNKIAAQKIQKIMKSLCQSLPKNLIQKLCTALREDENKDKLLAGFQKILVTAWQTADTLPGQNLLEVLLSKTNSKIGLEVLEKAFENSDSPLSLFETLLNYDKMQPSTLNHSALKRALYQIIIKNHDAEQVSRAVSQLMQHPEAKKILSWVGVRLAAHPIQLAAAMAPLFQALLPYGEIALDMLTNMVYDSSGKNETQLIQLFDELQKNKILAKENQAVINKVLNDVLSYEIDKPMGEARLGRLIDAASSAGEELGIKEQLNSFFASSNTDPRITQLFKKSRPTPAA